MSWARPSWLSAEIAAPANNRGISGGASEGPIPFAHRCLRVALLSCLPTLACWAGAAHAATSDDTPLSFRDERYVLGPLARVHRSPPDHLNYSWRVDNPTSRQPQHFARVRVLGADGSDQPPLFKVEAQPDRSSYELCYCPLHETNRECGSADPICYDIGIGVTDRSGVLYLVVPAEAPETVFHYVRDFVAQPVELSVSSGGRKVYREALIEPPDGTADCSDYPENDADRYACLYLGEESVSAAPTATEALLSALPDKLVKPREEYEVVFAEEFDGDTGRYPAGDCEGGLSNLDGDKWNFRETWCGIPETTRAPCETMQGGYYEMSWIDGCASGVDTGGKFSYKYGYIETRYTVSLDDSDQQNLNLVVGDPSRWLKYAAAKYGVPLRNYKEMSRSLPIELNVFEYFPERKRELTNYFYNFHPYLYYPHTEPRYASNWTRFCDDVGQGVRQLNFFTVAECGERTSVTVTKGLEWTPRGYRMLVKIEDLHDDFIVVSKGSTDVWSRPALTATTPTRFSSGARRYSGGRRDSFFEFLEPDNPESVLMNFTVSHAPMRIDFGAWRGFGNHGTPVGSSIRMKIDYVRVFQPKDRYAEMEPVYE